MTSPSQVLTIARRYVDEGYREGPNNDTVFGRRFGLNHAPWCDIFISDVFVEAGAIQAIAPKNRPKGFASCAEHLTYLTKNNQVVPIGKAQPGDLVFFQFDSDAEPDHVGLISRHNLLTKKLITYEGNTSGDSRGSQVNGDGCFKKVRAYPYVLAVARPKWDLVSK